MVYRRGCALGLALALACAAMACQASPAEQPCSDIPDGGCPGIDTTNCLDLTCWVIYTCQPGGGWVQAAMCPPHEAGAPPDIVDAGPRDVNVDVPGASGGPGCPDLQEPDCTLTEALVCGPGCCGCENILVCQDGGWIDWGGCGDGGPQPTP
jgi:hypothetical protein